MTEETLAPGTELQARVADLDWDLVDANTRYSTHGIHRYSGKFIPQIASQATELLTEVGEIVLDVYCGSGTTLLEAIRVGRRAVGTDLNPLACLISRAKVTAIEPSLLDDFLRRFREYCYSLDLVSTGQSSLFASVGGLADELWQSAEEDERLVDGWYTKWFERHALRELIAINNLVAAETDSRLRDLGLVALSDILRRTSHAHSSYPNVMYDKRRIQRPRPTPLFLARLEQIVLSVGELWSWAHQRPEVSIRCESASALSLEDSSVDAVVTHPPYVGSIPYAEYGYLSLIWLGYEPKELDRQLTGGRRQTKDVLARFRADYGKMFTEAGRVLRPGRALFLMVGHPVVRGVQTDLATMSISLAAEAGFQLQARATRSGSNRRSNQMGSEDLLFFNLQSV